MDIQFEWVLDNSEHSPDLVRIGSWHEDGGDVALSVYIDPATGVLWKGTLRGKEGMRTIAWFRGRLYTELDA